MVIRRRARSHMAFVVWMAGFAACSEAGDDGQPVAQPDGGFDTGSPGDAVSVDVAPGVPDEVPLSDDAWLVRASLDLRGYRPSAAEREAFAAASDRATWIESWLASEDFADRVGAWTALQFRTRIDDYPVGAGEFGFEEESGWHRALSDEVPALAEWIVLNDLPWSTLLRAPHTFVDPLLTEVWPVEPVSVEGRLPAGTVAVAYTDGRPVAGVLSSTALWWRHGSTLENANRGRANALTTALLCDDYLSQPIDFPADIDISDRESVANAIRTNPACVSCHATLDPIASHLWGFMRGDENNVFSVYYRPELEREWLRRNIREPAWFDEPSSTLTTLAEHIIRDPRFVSCAVERTWEQLMRRAPDAGDRSDLLVHREAFIASGLSIRALVRSIVLGDAYNDRSGAGPFGALSPPRGAQLASAEHLAITFERLAGVRFVEVGRPLESLDRGVRSLVGASDRSVSAEPSVGIVLFHRRLAEVAAERLLADPPPTTELAGLLAGADLSRQPDAATVAAILSLAHALPYGPESDAVASLVAFWSDVRPAVESPRAAWQALLTAILADPQMLWY